MNDSTALTTILLLMQFHTSPVAAHQVKISFIIIQVCHSALGPFFDNADKVEEERYTTHIFGTTYFRQLPQRPQNTTSLELCYCCQTHSPRHEAIGNYRENLIVRTFRYVCIFIQKLFWRTYFFMMTFWSSNL